MDLNVGHGTVSEPLRWGRALRHEHLRQPISRSRPALTIQIRRLKPRDTDALIELSVRAWAPVFASLAQVLGPTLDGMLHPDWRHSQQAAVRAVCDADDTDVWVAIDKRPAVGFVVTTIADPDRGTGAIEMIAVDPDAQRRGIGLALTERALTHLRTQGMKVAVVESGGDPGHQPARLLYQRAGFINLPIARYFQPL